MSFCTVRPFGDKAGLLRHGREVHGVQTHGGPAPDFRCSVAGCKRGHQGFSRQWNLNQHYRRVHERPDHSTDSPKALVRADAAGESKYPSDVDGDGSTESTPLILEQSGEIIGQASDDPGMFSGQQSRYRQNNAPLLVLQAELDSLKAKRQDTVSQLDTDISALEAALSVLRRDS